MKAVLFERIAVLPVLVLAICLVPGVAKASECQLVRHDDTELARFEGAENGVLELTRGFKGALRVSYNDKLDRDSFQAYLNGEDVTDRFVPHGAILMERVALPLDSGVNILDISAHLQEADAAGEGGCATERLLWQQLSIRRINMPTGMSVTVELHSNREELLEAHRHKFGRVR